MLDQVGVLGRVDTQETGSVFGVYSNFDGGCVSSTLTEVQSPSLVQFTSLKRIGNGGRRKGCGGRGKGSLCPAITVLE